MRNGLIAFIIWFACFSSVYSQMNSPYPASDKDAAIYYSSFTQRPKFLDPVKSYSSDEYRFIGNIYETVVQYHYLKRPYELESLTAAEIPKPKYYGKEGRLLTENDPSADKISKAVYTIRLREGILYQNHPCFAKNGKGEFLYHNLTEKQCRGYTTLFDYPETGTRELKAKDYVLQILRMADIRNHCPIFNLVVQANIKGMEGYAREYNKKVAKIRAKRRKEGGILYNQDEDEKNNPIRVDYFSIPCEGLKVIDDYTYEITLKKKLPQFLYWLAMPFFAPMPQEAIDFYSQGPNISRNITLNWFPVGTGAYRLAEYNPHHRIIMVKNENYHEDTYPSEGEKGDKEKGLLEDAGRRLPLIKKVVYSKEKEAAPSWLKFMQGYYDSSGISSDNFGQVLNQSVSEARLSDDMETRGLRLVTSVRSSIAYMGFNMLDPVIGGLDEKQCKLRQAVTIAIDIEEYLKIFANGRGLVAHSPIPPGIFGYKAGEKGVNPYTHYWDEKSGEPKRHSIEYAKKLLAEAGYPEGMKEGKRLVLNYDTYRSDNDYFEWLEGRLNKIGVTLNIRQTDYSRFRDKVLKGNIQFYSWGWNADYPDPENFLFLLYGPNGKVKYHGENASNYENKKFDELYKKMETMENTPERLKIIKDMTHMLQHDAPWQFNYFPVNYSLIHNWTGNIKPNLMANNTLKYLKVDPVERAEYRKKYNKPNLMVFGIIAALLILIIGPGFYMVLRKEMN